MDRTICNECVFIASIYKLVMNDLYIFRSQYFIVHVVSAAPVVYYTFINPPKKDKVEKSQ